MIPFANSAMSARNGAQVNFRLKTTVLGFGAVMFLIPASREPQPFDCLRASSIENLTSADVIVLPFENLTPGRSLNVYFLPPFEALKLVASQGFTFLPSGVTV